MNKYMHGTDKNQVAYHFCFQNKSGLISKGAKVTELPWYILNFIGLCMFLNVPYVTHLSLRIVAFVYLNDKVTLFVLGKIILR